MRHSALKRCHECGRVYDGMECPDCGWYAQNYDSPEEYEDNEDDLDAMIDDIIMDATRAGEYEGLAD